MNGGTLFWLLGCTPLDWLHSVSNVWQWRSLSMPANCVWLRPLESKRPLLRLWCQRFQLCEELHEVLWRLCQGLGVGAASCHAEVSTIGLPYSLTPDLHFDTQGSARYLKPYVIPWIGQDPNSCSICFQNPNTALAHSIGCPPPQEHGDARAGPSVSHPLVHPHGGWGHTYSPHHLRNYVSTLLIFFLLSASCFFLLLFLLFSLLFLLISTRGRLTEVV